MSETITSAAELDALPVGSVVRTSDRAEPSGMLAKVIGAWWCAPVSVDLVSAEQIEDRDMLPADLLYRSDRPSGVTISDEPTPPEGRTVHLTDAEVSAYRSGWAEGIEAGRVWQQRQTVSDQVLRGALTDFLSNEGDGGIWEHFDRANSEVVADAVLTWLASRPQAAPSDDNPTCKHGIARSDLCQWAEAALRAAGVDPGVSDEDREALDLLDEMNASGRIAYADYSRLHDALDALGIEVRDGE